MIKWFRNKNMFEMAKDELNEKGIFYTERKVKSNFVINVPSMESDGSFPLGFLNTKIGGKDIKVKIGNIETGENPIFISGYCTLENEENTVKMAKQLKSYGVSIYRGGCFKPRTSPYDFHGFGREALKWIVEAKKEADIPICVEILDANDLDLFIDVDLIQVGARNMQNHILLRELGKFGKPVLLKRGFGATVKEFLLSAEVMMLEGLNDIILCERGIRTFDDTLRNTLDLAGACFIKRISRLPIIIDPSHATGRASLVKPLSIAGISAGLDGVMTEVHENPDVAFSDRDQAILPEEMRDIISISKKIREVTK